MSSDSGDQNKKSPSAGGDFTSAGFGDKTRVATVTSTGAKNGGRILALLQITSGTDQGKIVQIPQSGRFTVGRGRESNLILHDRSCSRQHVEVWHENDDTYRLRDMGSTNGTRVNDKKISTEIELKSGDRIQAGDNSVMRFTLVTEEEAKAQIDVYHKATRDPLTGVWNRRQFEEAMKREMGFQQRSGPGLFLIMMDIDFFKRINDSFGHAAGDEVIKDFCRRVEASVRMEDTVARIGGEEFAVLGRADGLEGLQILTERIRSNVEMTPVQFEGRTIPYTVSLGCVYLEGKTTTTPEELYQRSDECLYESKHGGRNRVTIKVLS